MDLSKVTWYLFQRNSWRPADSAPIRTGWGVRECAVGLGLAVLVAGLLGIMLSPLSLAFDEDDGVYLAINALATLVFELGLLAIVYRLTLARGAEAPDLGLARQTWKLSASLLALLACYAALYAYVGIIGALDAPGLEPARQLPTAVFDYPSVLLILGLSVVFTAPFTEELFFRGFLFRGLSNSFGVWPAALVSGFVFSLAHINLGAIIPFTLIGAIFAISYQRTGTLWTPIATHFAFNLISFSILILIPEARN